MANHQQVDALFSRFPLDLRPGYAAFLQAHARALTPLEAVVRPEVPRLPLLAQDLAALGLKLPEPLMLDQRDSDGFRWGARYALEGSRLGGAMLERRVAPGLPRSYLSSVHEKGGWVAFQKSLDAAAQQGGDGWIDDAISGAEAAFALFAAAAAIEQAVGHG